MARSYLSIGCSPAAENCVQVSQTVDYFDDMMAECRKFRDMLIAKFTNCNKVEIKVKTFPHDFGTYAEVVVYYSETDPESEAQAIFIENNMPSYWTETDVLTFEYVPDEDEDF